MKNRKGFTLVEIMIVVSIIALLAVIATPNFVRARDTSRSSACINNLRILDSAKEQYAIQMGAVSGAAITSADISDFLKENTMPVCPAAGVYTLNNIGALPVCSLSGASSGAAPKSHRLD